MAVWNDLNAHAARIRKTNTRELFAKDTSRFKRYSREALGVLFDFSRQRLDDAAFASLTALADEASLREHTEAMYRGDKINVTEDRAVLHVALRQPEGANIGGDEIAKAVFAERARMLGFAENVRNGVIVSSAKQPFKLVVNIGIGGSDLGPAMAVEALKRFTDGGPQCAFVSNVDGNRLADILETADPKTTLFIVASKTFTTLETLTNARTARSWIKSRLGEQAIREHFAAVSVNHKAMDEFGVHPDYRFQMWDWVGGRYSLWSSIGVSIAIAIGQENFLKFLAGGHAMDEHFLSAPWAENLPALMGLIGVWNVDLLELPSLAVLPYDDRLRRFSAYLQQLEMESNGKHVKLDGTPVDVPTCPVIWGEPGNNAQHSFFQLLHQGVQRASMDFLVPAKSSCGNQDAQNIALANCLAQAEAFMAGNPPEAVRAELEKQKLPAARIEQLIPHKVHEGNRPSSIVMFEKLDPHTLGMLIALYEHKVFTQGVVWGVNSFDQWGVELGKKLADQLLPAVRDPNSAQVSRPGIAELLQTFAKWRAKS